MSSHRYEIIETWVPTEAAAINFCKQDSVFQYRQSKRTGFIVYRRAKKGGTDYDQEKSTTREKQL